MKSIVSKDGKRWNKVAEGEFANIKNNPIEQFVGFITVSARYVRLKAVRLIDGQVKPAAKRIRLREAK